MSSLTEEVMEESRDGVLWGGFWRFGKKGETGFEKEAERLEDIKEQAIFTYESLWIIEVFWVMKVNGGLKVFELWKQWELWEVFGGGVN